MPCITIPGGICERQIERFSPELLHRTLISFIAKQSDFTGYFSVASDDTLYLLFFFNGSPCSAGKSIGDKPFPLSQRNFLRETGRLTDSNALFSIHSTDPVLLKCLLLFIHDDLIAKAPVSLMNLESVVTQIQQQSADALIVLEKEGKYNFFFFKDGIKGKSYFADDSFAIESADSIDEQLLIYAYQTGSVPVYAMIYRSVSAELMLNDENLDQKEIPALLGNDMDKTAIFTPNAAKELVLAVQEGQLSGKIFSASTPCVIGRKDTDIIISDPMISKTHAAFQFVNGKLSLVDLNSTNGTIVNGKPVKRYDVVVGDIITLGSTKLKILQIPVV